MLRAWNSWHTQGRGAESLGAVAGFLTPQPLPQNPAWKLTQGESQQTQTVSARVETCSDADTAWRLLRARNTGLLESHPEQIIVIMFAYESNS